VDLELPLPKIAAAIVAAVQDCHAGSTTDQVVS